MKLDTASLKPLAAKLLVLGRKYVAFLLIVAFLVVYVYLVQLIGGLIQREPTQAAPESDLQPVKRLKIDENAIKRINELESQNVDVQSLLDQARQNPFAE